MIIILLLLLYMNTVKLSQVSNIRINIYEDILEQIYLKNNEVLIVVVEGIHGIWAHAPYTSFSNRCDIIHI